MTPNNQEIWKDIKSYKGFYQVSSLGRVRSLDRVQMIKNRWNDDLMMRKIKGKLLKIAIDSRGYPIVSLSKNGTWITKSVHRLVAIAFIPNPENKPEINHISHDPTDNSISNLEWSTRSENSIHSKYHDCINRRLSKNRFSLILNTKTGVFFYSEKEAADAHGLKKTTLRMYLNKLCKNKTDLIYA
jgi:hypothetical protein